MYHRSYLSFFIWEPMVISDKGSLILGKPPTDQLGQDSYMNFFTEPILCNGCFCCTFSQSNMASWSFPEVGLPQIIHVHSIFHDKPTISIIGVPPCIKTFISIKMVASPLYLHIIPIIHHPFYHLVMTNIAGWKIPTINGGFWENH